MMFNFGLLPQLWIHGYILEESLPFHGEYYNEGVFLNESLMGIIGPGEWCHEGLRECICETESGRRYELVLDRFDAVGMKFEYWRHASSFMFAFSSHDNYLVMARLADYMYMRTPSFDWVGLQGDRDGAPRLPESSTTESPRTPKHISVFEEFECDEPESDRIVHMLADILLFGEWMINGD